MKLILILIFFALKYELFFNTINTKQQYEQEACSMNIVNQLIADENSNLRSLLNIQTISNVMHKIVEISHFKKNGNIILKHHNGIVIFNNQIIGKVQNNIFIPITKKAIKIAVRSEKNKNAILVGNVNELKLLHMEKHDDFFEKGEKIYLDGISQNLLVGIAKNQKYIDTNIPWHKIRFVSILEIKNEYCK